MSAVVPIAGVAAPDAAGVHAQMRGVTRTYAGVDGQSSVQALAATDLTLRRGEFYAVIGPSGCGKSTLLDVLAGLSRPTSGTITFEGKRVDGKVPDGIGVVFQEDASFAWLTVADNIVFGLRRAGTDPAEVTRRLDFALGLMGLAGFAKSYPSQLSGGMRQRVCIARTLVMQPRMILLDEPFGALDAQTRLIMGDELLKLWRETGATVLLITHALDEAAMLSDRIGIMSARPGRILQEVTTNWPRERDSRVAADPGFGRITADLWKVLREESLKAMGQGAAR
ncbi:MAG: ABC transporter ATP-binding protein [Achromobacter sp.]